MKYAKEFQEALLVVLESDVDARLTEVGFRRSPRSIVYRRNLDACKQSIHFHSVRLNSPQGTLVMLVDPNFRIEIPEVTERALELVGEDVHLLGGAPDVLVNLPIRLTEPSSPPTWTASDAAEGSLRVQDAMDVIEASLLPLLDSIVTPRQLAEAYGRDDGILHPSRHQRVYQIAAWLLAGEPGLAREVAEQSFALKAPRRQFAAVFENLPPTESSG